MIETTLVVIKPDGVQRGLSGQVISRLENAGLKLVGMKMVQVTKDFSKKHYAPHVDKHFYQALEDFITEGPVIALAVEGLHAVDTVRKLVGPTEPKQAAPGTIRGDFAHHSYEYTDNKGIAIKNIVHASGTSKEAKEEISLWFGREELHNYRSVHEKHVY